MCIGFRVLPSLAALAALAALALLGAGAAPAESPPGEAGPDASWRMASRKSRDGLQWSVYEETRKTPGRPAFRIETSFEVSPVVAAMTLMEDMSEPGRMGSGETRRLIERSDREALVHTYIDLPFMFSDRELAVRIRHGDDRQSGVHRIDWVDENDALPPPGKGVLRLATRGYWEFRPMGPGRTSATYLSRAEVGGTLPAALGDRLLQAQAVDAVQRLQALLLERRTTHVAAPPPAPTSE